MAIQHRDRTSRRFLLALAAVLAISAPPARSSPLPDCSQTTLALAITGTNLFGGSIELPASCDLLFVNGPGGDGLPPITGTLTIVGNGARLHRDPSNPTQFRLLHVAQTGHLTLRD